MTRRGFEYLLLLSWVFLCAYTFYEAQSPGFEDLGRWKYPWAGAAAVCASLGILIAALYGVTRIPARPWRLVAVTGYVIVLLCLLSSLFITDQRGHFYVPGQFAVVALVGVIVWCVLAWWKGSVLAA